MDSKTAVITGASDGIGLKTAEGLAARGYNLVMIGRNPAKTAAAAAGIRRAAPGIEVATDIADLSVQAEIRALAARLEAAHPRIDVLINNAGALFTRRRLSADGIEMTLALNHLGYFLLTGLLLKSIATVPDSRIVIVASEAHRGPPPDLDDLQLKRRYRGWRAYQQSKMCNLLFGFALARRLADRGGPTVNCLHPGFVASRFGGDNPLPFRLAFRALQALFAISPEAGAATSVHVASESSLTGVSGGYFLRSRPAEPAAATRDLALQDRLWAASAALTGFTYP